MEISPLFSDSGLQLFFEKLPKLDLFVAFFADAVRYWDGFRSLLNSALLQIAGFTQPVFLLVVCLAAIDPLAVDTSSCDHRFSSLLCSG